MRKSKICSVPFYALFTYTDLKLLLLVPLLLAEVVGGAVVAPGLGVVAGDHLLRLQRLHALIVIVLVALILLLLLLLPLAAG